MKLTSNLSSLLGLLLLLLSACAGSDETHFTRLGLGEAESIFLIANGDNGFDELAFYDSRQRIQKVRYFDENDNEIEFEGEITILDANEEYFLMETYVEATNDHGREFNGYVVRKRDGATFSFESYRHESPAETESSTMGVQIEFDVVYSDAENNMYLNFNTWDSQGRSGTEPFRITVSDQDTLSLEELPGTTNFAVNSRGHSIHWINSDEEDGGNIARIIHPSGRVENRTDIQAFWRGVDDIFVITEVREGKDEGREDADILRLVEGEDGDFELEKTEIDTAGTAGTLVPLFGDTPNVGRRYTIDGRLIVLDSGDCVEIENPEQELYVHSRCGGTTLDGRTYYQVEEGPGVSGIIKYELDSRTETEILPAKEYDIAGIELLDTGLVYFGALRLSDGVSVKASVNDKGEVIIWDEKPFQGKIETLIRIR